MNVASFPKRPDHQRVVLILQGGGALGAYQAGVFQALHEHGFDPDWIGGTSIGAIDALRALAEKSWLEPAPAHVGVSVHDYS